MLAAKELTLGLIGALFLLPMALGPAVPSLEDLALVPFQSDVRFMEATANGNISLAAAEAALEAVGPTVTRSVAPRLAVTFYEFERSKVAVKVPYDSVEAEWNTAQASGLKVTKTTFEDAALTFNADVDGRVLAWPADGGRSSFTVSLADRSSAQILGYPQGYDFIVDRANEEVRHQTFAPLVALGTGIEPIRYDLDVPEALFKDARVSGVDLVLDGGHVEVHHATGTSGFETGTWASTSVPERLVPETDATSQKKRAFAVVHLSEDASAFIDMKGAETQVLFMAKEPEWTIDGTLTARIDEGHVQLQDERWRLDEKMLQLTGNITLRSDLIGGSDDYAAPGFDALGWQFRSSDLPLPPVEGSIAGQADEVRIAGDAIHVAPPPGAIPDASFFAKVAGVLLVGWLIVRHGLGLIVVLLSRAPLQNARRRQIYGFIEQHGIGHVREIHGATGIPIGTVTYHLRILQKAGLVQCIVQEGGRYRVCFPTSARLDHGDMQRLALLTTETRRRIARILVLSPGTTQEALADMLDVARSTISRQLTVLSDAGLVEQMEAHPRGYQAAPLLRRWFTGSD